MKALSRLTLAMTIPALIGYFSGYSWIKSKCNFVIEENRLVRQEPSLKEKIVYGGAGAGIAVGGVLGLVGLVLASDGITRRRRASLPYYPPSNPNDSVGSSSCYEDDEPGPIDKR